VLFRFVTKVKKLKIKFLPIKKHHKKTFFMKSKYLFLYLKTGGGHLAPARSIAKYLERNNNETIEPVLIDGLAQSEDWVKKIVEDGYRNSQKNAQWAFMLLYALNKIAPFASITALVFSRFVKPYLLQKIKEENPKKIVVFHFLLIKPVLDILKELHLNIPVITVVTDPYTAHLLWFLRKEPEFIVFSEELKNKIANKRIPASKIHVFPFVLDEKFNGVIAPERVPELKTKYGFQNGKKLILIMGGGDGIPRGKSILKKIIEANIDADVAIVCGKDRSLLKTAVELKERYAFKHLKIYGFINFVHELVNISDVVITKCGASTFMEILISGKIPIINTYIWEQEKGNVEFVQQNGMGVYERSPKKLPEIINRLFDNANILAHFHKNIKSGGLQNGTPLVSQFITNF